MKWFSFLSLAALAFLGNACEKHPASELPKPHATMFGEHAAGHDAGHDAADPHAAPHAETHAEPAKHAEPAAHEEGKPEEAPKFFPEKK